ncbi:MAG: Ig-like domain-containing protein [Prevotella sp.]|nr:Ig-like domain-containing protein [Prevotella sp.]
MNRISEYIRKAGTGRTAMKAHAATATWILLAIVTLAGCAKMGQPDGGWYDETPPSVVGATPNDKGVNVKARKINIYFDEFIKVDNPTEKVVISPPQIEVPEIKTTGKGIRIELKDSLKPNTTYTIDFSDAISDNNEGNPMGNYTYSFSTGDHIDTMEVAGKVLDASNLEPVKGILVGLYAMNGDSANVNPTDTADAFRTLPLLRVSRTDSRGQFVIKGIAHGTYRICALQDLDNNYYYSQKAEMAAYSTDLIVPTSKPDTRMDTIWRDSLLIDSLIRVPYTHFLPDDIVLRAFTAVQTDRYFLKSERQTADHFTLFFSYGDKTLPEIKGLNFNHQDAFLIEANEKKDTITYWLKDTTLVNQDTLRLEMTYNATDTTGARVVQTDTLEVLAKESYEKRMKKLNKEYEEWMEKQEKRKKKGLSYDSIMPPVALEPEYSIQSEPAPNENIAITMPAPLQNVDTAKIHLYSKIDTLWYRSKFIFRQKEKTMRTYEILGEWRPGIEYSLEIDSAAFTDIYGKSSEELKRGFRIRPYEDFGNLQMSITGMNGKNIVVQMLNKSDEVVKEVMTNNGIANFFYVLPGIYYVRMYVDSNNNMEWDTGDYTTGEQPEETYYYNKEIECKAKWDINLSWDPKQLNLAKQKPLEITKQKPEKEKTIKRRNEKRARDMGIPYNGQK